MTVSFVFRARDREGSKGNPAAPKSRARAREAATETDSRLVRSVLRQIRIETWVGRRRIQVRIVTLVYI